MQPLPTLYSGVCRDRLLKFCSEECKKFWLPTPNDKSICVAYCSNGTCQSQKTETPPITAIFQEENGVEQFYLDIGEESGKLGRPYIVWHIRELEIQLFAHFYITEDCLPLNSVWTKQCCTGESEFISHYIASNKLEVQSHVQTHLNQAANECNFADLQAFLKQVEGVSLYYGKLKDYNSYQHA